MEDREDFLKKQAKNTAKGGGPMFLGASWDLFKQGTKGLFAEGEGRHREGNIVVDALKLAFALSFAVIGTLLSLTYKISQMGRQKEDIQMVPPEPTTPTKKSESPPPRYEDQPPRYEDIHTGPEPTTPSQTVSQGGASPAEKKQNQTKLSEP